MIKSIAAVFRVSFVILALLLGQVQAVLALEEPADSVPSVAEPGAEQVVSLSDDASGVRSSVRLLPDPRKDCALRVNGFIITDDLPPGYPDVSAGPNYYGVDLLGIVEDPSFYPYPPAIVERNPGDTIKWLMVIQNYTDFPSDGGCGSPETLTQVIAKLEASDGVFTNTFDIPLTFPTTDGELAPGELAYAVVDYTIPMSVAGVLTLVTWAAAEDSTNSNPLAGAPNDTIDRNTDRISMVGPGFSVVSFEPNIDPPEAAPGEDVSFTLIIENSRPGSTITGVSVSSPQIDFQVACTDYPFSGAGNWTPVGGGSPITSLAPGAQAQCIIPNVTIPNDPPPDTLALTGEVTVTDGDPGRDVTLPVTSDPVTVLLPTMSVTKRVLEIRRGGTAIYTAPGPLPSAAPGDVITYEIVVTNTGSIELVDFWIVDSLTGVVYLPPGFSLPPDPPDDSITLTATHIVREGGQDPLTNKVTVTARGTGFPDTISVQASAAVDIRDSALEVELTVENLAGDPIFTVDPLETVRYRMRLTNAGSEEITSLRTILLSPPLRTVGAPPDPLVPNSLAAGGSASYTWTYEVQETDPDPLVSTVRVRGLLPSGQLIYGQDQASLDITNPDINIQVFVLEPETSTVLRGGQVVYDILITNGDPGNALCGVNVRQLRRDPDTGIETPLIPSVPMDWTTPGRLETTASATTTYLVTGEDKDPLDMIFEVKATIDCDSGLPLPEPLSDRTTRVLDISDVQLNVELVADLGPDGLAQIGDAVEFTFLAQNVGAVTLEDLSATWCILHRATEDPPICDLPFDPGHDLNPTTIGSFDDTSGRFTYTLVQPPDADAAPFVAQVTMLGRDNKNNEVSIKAATIVPVATDALVIDVNGPEEAVEGDTESFGYSITNETGGTLSDVHVNNMLVPDAGGYLEVGYHASISGTEGSNVVTGSFDYTIAPNTGIQGGILTLPLLVTGETAVETVQAIKSTQVVLIPMVLVEKTGDPSVVAGEEVHYHISITNQSHSQMLTITDYEDVVFDQYGVAYDHGSFATWPGTPGELPWGTMVEGDFLIPSPPGVDAAPNPLTNTFVVTGARSYDGGTVAGAGNWSVSIACPIAFMFQVENLDDEPEDILGETLRWRPSFQNVSGDTLTNIEITEELFFGGAVASGEITWPNPAAPGTLTPGQTAYLGSPTSGNYFDKVITSDFYSGDPDFMSDSMTAVFSNPEGSSSCVEDYNYPVYSPIWPFKIPTPSLAFSGETVDYELIVYNAAEANDGVYSTYYVTVTDSLLQPNPVPFQYEGPANPASTSGYLGPDETVTTTLSREVQPTDPPELINTMIAEFPDPHPDYDVTLFTPTWALVLTANPLALTKTPSVALGARGSTITYDYTITNVSLYTVEDIAMVDDVIGDLIPGRTGGLISLAPGETYQVDDALLDVQYVIPLDAPDPLVNTVTATGTVILPEGPRQITNSLTVELDLEDPEIEITKTVHYNVGGSPGSEVDDNYPPSGPDGIPEVETGTEVFYCFFVENKNTGGGYVDNIVIEDAMFPPGALQTAFQDAVMVDLGHSAADADLLNDGESVTFCYGPFTLSTALGDPVENLVTLDGDSSGGYPIHVEATKTVDILGEDLLVTKAPSKPLAFVGDEITFTIMLENRNSSDDIVVQEVYDTFTGDVPQLLDLASFDWSQSGVDGSPVGVLAPNGGRATFTYPYTVKSSDPDPLTNVASAYGLLDESPLPEDQWQEVFDSTRATVAVTKSQLIVRKTATPNVARASQNNCEIKGDGSDDRALPECEMVTYRISIYNAGSKTVHDIMAVDEHFDAINGVMVEAVYQDGDLNPSDTLAPGFTAYIYYDLPMPTVDQLLANPELDPFLNTVRVYGIVFDEHGQPIPITNEDPADPYDDDKSLKTSVDESVDIYQPNIRIIKSPVTLAAAPGQTVSYNVTISNTGDDAASLSGLVFTDEIGPQTVDLDAVCPNVNPAVCPFVYGAEPYADYDSNPDTPNTANPLEGDPYDPGHGLLSKEQLRGVVTVTVPVDWSENEFTNVVEITGVAAPAGDPVIDRASATIDIREEGINVEKFASVSAAPVGTPITYTVRITNIGGTAIERVVISDPGIDAEPTHTVTVEDGFPESPEEDVPGPDTGTLDPGEVFEYEYIHTLLETDGDPYVNRVTVTGYTATGTVINVAQTAVDVLTSSIEVEKFVCAGVEDGSDPAHGNDNDPSTLLDPCLSVVNVGDGQPDTVTYYLHFVNPSYVPVENIVVSDTVGNPGPITWPLAGTNGLAADDGVPGSGDDELWVMYTYPIEAGDPDPLVNLVTVTGQPTAGGPVQDTASASLALITSDLRLTKSGPATAVLGQEVTYTLEIENVSQAGTPINDVQVIDPLSPDGSNPILDCSTTTLAVGSPVSCQFAHTVSLADGSPLVNTAMASGLQSGVPVSDSASYSIEIVTPGLSVSKTADTTVAQIGPGADPVTFTYRIENTGSSVIDELVVVDSDPGAVFADAGGTPTAWPTLLAPGQVAVRYWERTMTAQDPDPYINTMTVTGRSGGQPLRAEASETVYIANGVLVVSNTPTPAAYVLDGGTVSFAYTVTNLGEDPLNNLTLSDNLCDDAALNAQLASTTLQGGASATVYCTVIASLPGPVVSTVYAEAQEPPIGTPVYDTATAEVAVTSGGLVVVKSADRATVLTTPPDNVITYTIEVTNIGAESLTDFVVDDPIVGSLSPAPPATLAANGSFTMTGTYTVPTVDPPGSVSNTAMVTATGATTGNQYTDSDSASVAVLENPDAVLMLIKEASTQHAEPAGTIHYTLTVRNIGSDPVSNIAVTDTQLGLDEAIPDLAPGNSWTLTASDTVPATWSERYFTNTAEVTIDGVLEDTASASVLVDLLTLEKTPDPAAAAPGEEITYTFTVTNLSFSTIGNVSLEDPLIDTWDQTLPSSIPPEGATAIGRATIPPDWEAATYDNTAQVLIGLEPVTEDTASVDIVLAGLSAEIVSIEQISPDPDGGPDVALTDPVQTGEPVRVNVHLENVGAEPINTVAYEVTFDIPNAVCQHTGDPLPATLAAGEFVDVTCTYTPPIGLDTYVSAGLARTVTLNAAGAATSGPVTDTDTATMNLVDLQLRATLSVTPSTVAVGQTIAFTLTLQNTGASTIGCDGAVSANEPCHLTVATNNTIFDDLIEQHRPAIANLVLDHGESQVYVTGTYVILATDTSATITVNVHGGYYSAALEGADLLGHYVLPGTGATDSTDLIVEAPEITVNISVSPNPPIFGQSVTYGVTVTNTGQGAVQGLSATYQINPLAAVPGSDSGIMLVSGGAHPALQTSGPIALNPTILYSGDVAHGFLSKIEDQTGPYNLIVTVIGQDMAATVQVSDSADMTITPTGTGTPTATVDPATLDPNAVNPIVTKSAEPTQAQPGGQVVWTITVRNGHTETMSTVAMTDALADVLTINSAITDRGVSVIDGQTVSVTAPTLNPGEIITVTINTTVSADADSPSSILNSACASRAGGPNQCVSATVNIGPDVGGLPATGIHSAVPSGEGGLPGFLGLVLAGALLILMGAQASNRRMWFAVGFLVVAVVVVAAAALLLVSGGDEDTPSDVAEGSPESPVATGESPDVTPDDMMALLPPTPTPYIVPTPAGPRYLMIPKLADQFEVPIPIVDVPIINRQWDVTGLGYYVGWLDGTTWMDPQWGNTVLAAHVQLGFNNPGPFWGLGELVPGDEIVITEGAIERRFKVTSTMKVDPNDWTVTAPTNGPTLTLITCTEWDRNYGVFSQRMVIRAVPASES